MHIRILLRRLGRWLRSLFGKLEQDDAEPHKELPVTPSTSPTLNGDGMSDNEPGSIPQYAYYGLFTEAIPNVRIGRRMFALVIGIDEYALPGPSWLCGCVTDSRNMVVYLKKVLGVPDENIVHLMNTNATRRAILDSFSVHLLQNSRIAKGDSIIFYFAGHGGRQRAPPFWVCEENKVEVLCPYDVKTSHGIPDYTIAAFLRRLQYEKGDSITVILDSCHSGGMVRDENERLATRSYDPLDQLPFDLDHDIWAWNPTGSRASDDAQPDLPGSMSSAVASSVLLAACQPQQRAQEQSYDIDGVTVRCGAFTTALLTTLPRSLSNSNLTYHDLITRLPPLKVKDQNPCCVGKYQHRRLFSPSVDEAGFGDFDVIEEDGTYYVTAGDFIGVVPGTIFETAPVDGEPTIRLVADRVETHRCSVRTEAVRSEDVASFPKVIIATLGSRLCIEIHPVDSHNSDLADSSPDSAYSIVESGGDLKILFEDDSVVLVRDDPLMRKYCPKVRKEKGSINSRFLRTAARFNFYLYHSPSSDQRISANVPGPLVRLALKELSVSVDHMRKPQYCPRDLSQDLFHHVVSSDYTAEAEISGSLIYGFELENHSPFDLFLYAFHFDPAKYAITSFYESDWPLVAETTSPSRLPILGNTSGWRGFKFSPSPGLQKETAFIKVFASTVKVNMSNLLTSAGRMDMDEVTSFVPEASWDSWVYAVSLNM